MLRQDKYPFSTSSTTGAIGLMADDNRPNSSSGSKAGSNAGIAGLAAASLAARWEQDGWRQLRTPGAYECWHFDAFDPVGNGVAVDLYDGLAVHPRYLRELDRYYRFKKHHQLSAVREQALPGFYPAAAISLFQGGRCLVRSLNLYPPGSFKGERGSPEIAVGPNRITLRQDGSIGLVARGYPMAESLLIPRHRTDQFLLVELTFQPTFNHPPLVQAMRPPAEDGVEHSWILSAPHCKVSGRLQHISASDDVMLVDMPMQGLGYHDHYFGGSGLLRGVRSLSRGRVLGEDWAVIWNAVSPMGIGAIGKAPRGRHSTDSIAIFQAGADPVIIEHPDIEVVAARTSGSLVRYPATLDIHGGDARGNNVELLVHHDTLLESTPWSVRNNCSIQLQNRDQRRLMGRGLMETLSVRRMHWPVLSDLARRSILSIDADDPLWRQ